MESTGSSEKTGQIGNTGNADEKMLTGEDAKRTCRGLTVL